MDNEREQEQKLDGQESRKAYTAPELTRIGSLAELTQAIAGSPTDGGGVGNEGSLI